MLAFGEGKSLRLVRLNDHYRPTASPATLSQEREAVFGIDWTTDGKMIVYMTGGIDTALHVIAPRLGARARALTGVGQGLSITQLLPDGSAVATQTSSESLGWRVDLSVSPVKMEKVNEAPGNRSQSPDGKLVVFTTVRNRKAGISIADSDGSHERVLVTDVPAFTHPAIEGAPVITGWSPDGKWIAFTVFPMQGNADLRSRLYIVSSAGGAVRRLGKEAEALYNPVWSHDGKALFATQGWSMEDRVHGNASALVKVSADDGSISQLADSGIWPQLSPDGRVLYFFTSPYTRLSRVSTDDGKEETLGETDAFDFVGYAVGARYLYLFRLPPKKLFTTPEENASGVHRTLVRMDPETREITSLAKIDFAPRNAFLSADERYLYLEEFDGPKRRAVRVTGLTILR
jgi:Tol biopolymer transport system component